MRSSWLLTALVIALASTSQGIAETPDLAGVLPGDRWTYDVTDEITTDLKNTVTVVVVDVSAQEINTRVSSRGTQRPRQVVFDRGWSRIDDDLWKFAPSDGSGIQLPLQVGKEWRVVGNGKNFQSGDPVRSSGQSIVTGQEKNATGASTFEALKIEARMRHGNPNDHTKVATLTSTL